MSDSRCMVWVVCTYGILWVTVESFSVAVAKELKSQRFCCTIRMMICAFQSVMLRFVLVRIPPILNYRMIEGYPFYAA